MAVYMNTKYLSLPQQVSKNKNDIEVLKEDITNIDTIISGAIEGTIVQEVIDARQGEITLGANITNVKSQLAEQDNLKRDKSQPIYMVDLSTEVKTAMTGGSVAVVGENSVGTENIINKKVTIEKTDFLNNNSPNLFNKDTVTPGYYINDGNGALVADAGYNVSAYIPVDANSIYVKNNTLTSWAVYTSDNVYISSISNNTVVIPANGAYVRFTIPNADLNTQMFCKTSLPSSYVSYYSDVELSNVVKVSENNCSFVAVKSRTVNMFDKAIITDNTFVVNSTGELYSYTDWATTGFIPIYKDRVYQTNGAATSFAFFDKFKKFISGGDGNTATAPSNAVYVRWSIDKANISVNDFMVAEQGTMPPIYVPYEAGINFIDFTPSNSNKIGSNVLYGKTALFNGDSICMANWWAGYVANRSGYAKIIGEANNMTWVNYGIGGGTIAYKDPGTYCISRSIASMQSTADYIILEGGLNDFRQSISLGTITPDYNTAFDDTTFCGGFESMLSQLVLKYPNKKIGFILIHKTRGEVYPYGRGTAGVEVYYNLIIQMCQKWSIPLLDLFNESSLNANIDSLNALYFYTADGTHPLESTYRNIIAPKIEAWMKTL